MVPSTSAVDQTWLNGSAAAAFPCSLHPRMSAGVTADAVRFLQPQILAYVDELAENEPKMSL